MSLSSRAVSAPASSSGEMVQRPVPEGATSRVRRWVNQQELDGFLSSSAIPLHQRRWIVLLAGAGSVGKTSLALAMQEHGWHVVIGDAPFAKAFDQEMWRRFPGQMAVIALAIAPENRYLAIRTGDLLFIEECSTEQRQQAQVALEQIYAWFDEGTGRVGALHHRVVESLQKEVDEGIRSALLSKQDVIIDTFFTSMEHLESSFPEAFVVQVFVACPLLTAWERLLERNQHALKLKNLSERRCLGSLLMLYAQDFSWATEPGQEVCFPFNPTEAESLFDEMERNSPSSHDRHGLKLSAMTDREVREVKNRFIPRQRRGEQWYVQPQFPDHHSLILDSSCPPEENARVIVETLGTHQNPAVCHGLQGPLMGGAEGAPA